MKPLEELSTQRTGTLAYIAVAAATVIGLVFARYHFGYLLFHGLVEVFSIAIAAGTFMITWNLRRYFDVGYLLVVAIGLFFAAGVDLIHTFAYRGMGVFPDATADLATQLWLVARYIQAATLLAAAFFFRRAARPVVTFWVFAAATLALLSMIFAFGVFPTAFVEGSGLTPFKIYSEYAISATMLLALLLLWRNRRTFPRDVASLLMAAIATAIASELAFTLYTDPFGPWNLIGHLLKVATFFLIYRAVAETVLTRPSEVLLHDLREATEELAASEERFRLTFEQASLGIAHVALDGRWLRLNRRLSEIAGHPLEELQRMRPQGITHPDDIPHENELIGKLLAGEIRQYRLEKRYIRKDGTIAWVAVSRSLLRSADGKPLHFVAIVEDITDRKIEQEALRRSRDLTEALNEIDLEINATADVDEIARITAEKGCAALEAESASVLMVEGDRWRPSYLHRFPTEPIPVHAPADRRVPVADQHGAPLVIEDAANDGRIDPDTLRALGIVSLITVPLRFRGEDLGVVYFAYHSKQHRFSQAEIDFARSLSSSASLAVENARLTAAQSAIAETIESALLAMPARIEGLEFAHAYRSATELTRIGGDFYDLFEVCDGTVAFVLGDVSGKGLEAATLTAMAKSTIRAFAYHDHRPSAVLEAANAAVASQIGESRFITALYGTIHMPSGTLRLANAGHPRAVVCTTDPACPDEVTDSSPPLGVLPDTTFAEFETTLDPDSLIAVFSDGLIEARNDQGFLGEEKVRETVRACAPQGPDAVVKALIEQAEQHCQGRIGDDVAIVVLRYLGRA